jgi:N-acetyl-anhydromuramyl-L-alanine amidase AmpD
MKASDLMRDWPADVAGREEKILEAIDAGHYVRIDWVPLAVDRQGQRGRVWVASDALMVGEPGDCVRVNVTAHTAQRIADRLGARLPTTYLIDEVQRQMGTKLSPCIQPPDQQTRLSKGYSPNMSDTEAMKRHHEEVQAKLEALAEHPGIVCNVGKHWVVSNRLASQPDRAANYGWFDNSAPYRSASGIRMWQSLGLAHDAHHVDYSQVLQLVREEMEAGEMCIGFDEVATDEALHVLVSDEGPLKVTRQPGVPFDEATGGDPGTSPTLPAFPAVEPPTHRDELGLVDEFIEARNYTKVDRSEHVKHVVIHTAEIAEVFTAAEALARWCAGPNAPRASWHFAVDADSITQSVKEEYIAWHAPGCNKTGIGVELAGRAKQSTEEWQDEFSRAVLVRAARLVAYLCTKWKIPVRFVQAEGLKRGERGVTTHAHVTMAFRRSTHIDPGRGFPMGEFLAAVKSYQEPGHG